jgi:serine/threonine protein kinase
LPLRCGTRLGVSEIIAAIGEGGMGQVFRARDTSLDRDVAIRILPEAAVVTLTWKAGLKNQAADGQRLARADIWVDPCRSKTPERRT